jgi:hypothetical protein
MTIPCGNGKDGKAPHILEWSKWCSIPASESELEQMVARFGSVDKIGMPLGPANGLVAFDFDYGYDKVKSTIDEKEFAKDLKNIERKVLSVLPYTPARKVGRKGFTAFYKWNSSLVNMQINRNGVRLFDFLSDGRQTILPPSVHSMDGEKVIKYRWIEQDILHCKDEIPTIDMDMIRELAMLLGTKDAAVPSGRHSKLFWYAVGMIKIEKDKDRLADLMVAKDIEMNGSDPKGPYLSDVAHNKTKDARVNAAHWLGRILKFNEKFSTEVKEVKLNDDAWAYFFKRSFFDLRKDILSKKIFVKRDGVAPWESFEPLDGVLRAFAGDSGLAKSAVKDEMARFSFMKTDLDFLCDLPKWDGTDYVGAYARGLRSPEFNSSEISEIFMEWGANIFARIKSSKNQNTCIILKGEQNMGKDTFVRNMLEGFSPYYELISPPSTQKDWLEIVSRLFIVHIEEFDQTAKVDMPFLKSLITQPSTFFRESYGRDPNRKTTAPSFISTANPDDFLRDPTGNRRFVVIPLDGISFDYPKGVSPQILSQFRAAFEAGDYRASKSTDEKIKAIITRMTPDGSEPWIEDLWRELFETRFPARAAGLNQSEAGGIFLDISKMAGCTPSKVRRVLKTKGYQVRDHESRKWMRTKVVYEVENGSH